MRLDRLFLRVATLGLLAAFAGACSDGTRTGNDAAPSPSSGQVAPVAPSSAVVSRYAAARFLEQASFGPTPAEIDHVRAIGFAAWIDEQFALPVSQTDTERWRTLNNPRPDWSYDEFVRASYFAFLNVRDQLRLRLAWALSQYVVVSQAKVQEFAALEYFNLLRRAGPGDYGALLRAVTIHAAMGNYLDNGSNRPAEACNVCAPNENYARELMQLFTLGVYRLGPDGSILRDARGKPMPTYTQDDVEELARALTGWKFQTQAGAADLDWANYRTPMAPSPNPKDHDDGAKTVLGSSIPAGLGVAGDLDAVVAILVAHPNIAPFVSLRLIQHFVTSDPTPEYVARVAAVFRNDGAGRVGKLSAVVKAILLDPEARRGDVPGTVDRRVGKFRESVTRFTTVLRGMGCTTLPNDSTGTHPRYPGQQTPLSANSVFSFYLPTDRTAATQLLAPEERLLSIGEFSERMGDLAWSLNNRPQTMTDAGCAFKTFTDAYQRGADDFLDLVSDRYFRSSMSPTLRATGKALHADVSWGTVESRAMHVLLFLLSSPSFGVMR